jgi:hypothetical protein
MRMAALISTGCIAAASRRRRSPVRSIFGDDLRWLPLSERKGRLRKLLRRSGHGIQYVWHVEADAAESFNAACELGLEGIVSKRLSAPYKVGSVQELDQGEEPEVAGLLADH